MTLSAPDCRIWSKAPRKIDHSKRATERATQGPMLEWLHKSNKDQVTDGRAYINENPWGSAIFRDSPLQKNENIPGRKLRRGDQCRNGAICPVTKAP